MSRKSSYITKSLRFSLNLDRSQGCPGSFSSYSFSESPASVNGGPRILSVAKGRSLESFSIPSFPSLSQSLIFYLLKISPMYLLLSSLLSEPNGGHNHLPLKPLNQSLLQHCLSSLFLIPMKNGLSKIQV